MTRRTVTPTRQSDVLASLEQAVRAQMKEARCTVDRLGLAVARIESKLRVPVKVADPGNFRVHAEEMRKCRTESEAALRKAQELVDNYIDALEG